MIQARGHGFIRQDSGDEDLFLHHRNIKGKGCNGLNDGDLVEYEIGHPQKGPCAENVVKLTGKS